MSSLSMASRWLLKTRSRISRLPSLPIIYCRTSALGAQTKVASTTVCNGLRSLIRTGLAAVLLPGRHLSAAGGESWAASLAVVRRKRSAGLWSHPGETEPIAADLAHSGLPLVQLWSRSAQ